MDNIRQVPTYIKLLLFYSNTLHIIRSHLKLQSILCIYNSIIFYYYVKQYQILYDTYFETYSRGVHNITTLHEFMLLQQDYYNILFDLKH